jgi:hypothetical protein
LLPLAATPSGVSPADPRGVGIAERIDAVADATTPGDLLRPPVVERLNTPAKRQPWRHQRLVLEMELFRLSMRSGLTGMQSTGQTSTHCGRSK